jgi:hypothetical protein
MHSIGGMGTYMDLKADYQCYGLTQNPYVLRATANHKAAVRTLSRDTHCIYLRRLPSIPQPSD